LVTGTYQIIVFANSYRDHKTADFGFVEGEDLDVGEIPLQSWFLVTFSDIEPCSDLPSDGGKCRYSVNVTNRQSIPLQGAAWSVVDAFGIGPVVDFTRFQPQRSRQITLGPGESSVVQFSFEVPSMVRDNAFICTQVFIGQGDTPFFAPIGWQDLFCITKGTSGLSIMSEAEVKQLRQRVRGQSLIPPQKKGLQKPSPKHGR
jgi:hypothetical protein